MTKALLGLFILIFLWVGGCGQNKKDDTSEQKKTEHPSGINPFPYPDRALLAKVGEFVLAPPERIVQAAYEKKMFFTYYRRNVSQVGAQESYLKIDNRDEKIPNVLIIPLGSSPGAHLGDIVLTSNPGDNHSLARGIVAEGGTDLEPLVHYLEIRELSRLDNRKFKLSPGTFRVLKSSEEPGSELLCKEKENFRGVTLIHKTAELYLARNYLGAINVYKHSDCKPIPLRPQFQVGDKVLVPIGSFYREGTVKKIEDRLGRVYVEYKFGKLVRERTFPYGMVATAEL